MLLGEEMCRAVSEKPGMLARESLGTAAVRQEGAKDIESFGENWFSNPSLLLSN